METFKTNHDATECFRYFNVLDRSSPFLAKKWSKTFMKHSDTFIECCFKRKKHCIFRSFFKAFFTLSLFFPLELFSSYCGIELMSFRIKSFLKQLFEFFLFRQSNSKLYPSSWSSYILAGISCLWPIIKLKIRKWAN